jgi:hypothetical protein
MTLEELNTKVQAIDIEKVITDTVLESQSTIVDTITQDQLYDKGIKGDGMPTGDYSPVSIALKKDPRKDHITLKEEGDFYAGYKVYKAGQDFEITSTDWKNIKLERQFGKEIFELTKENEAEIINKELNPILLQKVQKAID